MTEMPEEIFIYKAKDSGQIYLLPDYQTTLPHAVKYHRAALQAPQPEEVTVEELSQEYVDAVYAAFPNADLNRHSAISQDFLHFISRFKPQGIRIIREKSE